MLLFLEKVVAAAEAALGWEPLKGLLGDVVANVTDHGETLKRLEQTINDTAAGATAAVSSTATELRAELAALKDRIVLLERQATGGAS